MIKKKHKLNLTNFNFDINPLKIINHKYFTLLIYKNNLGYYRIGVFITKKVFNKSTIRNKIKRMILNYSQKILELLKDNTSFDFLFKPKPEIKDTTKKELFLELNNVFKNL